MTRLDQLSDQIEIDKAALRESTGSVYEVIRAHLIGLLDKLGAMTAGEGMEVVE